MADRIRDRYEPLQVAGRGGQGEVLRALDHQHGRHVALKAREVSGPTDELLAEARILLGLKPHPNLPLVREDFFEDGRYYMAVDWIDGRSLQDILESDGSPGLSLDEVVRYLSPVADALEHLHAHDSPVVHGDVKPANIIATPDGSVVLVDFGIASVGGEQRAIGSAGYVAPEIGAGARPTPAADVFGLAATAFALLSGGPPGSGATPGWFDLTREHAKRIGVTMRRALSVDPARRPVSARALVDALATFSDIPNNLPLLLSSFIGRDAEIEEVKRLVPTSRLVTLAAAGGVGKTRLSIQVASELLEDYPDGAWLVELAPLTDPGLVPQAVVSALGVREEPGRTLHDTLTDHLLGRELLIVLDNCEHLVEACARLAESILRVCPRIRVLATTREPLGIDGEVVYRVPTLSEAATLFVDRARLAKPGFSLTPDNAPVVEDICRRLDGIPLAIELAAARVKVLTPEQIDERLDDAFKLLTGGSRTALPRQQTLRALVDWSYDLLSEEERLLFNRLSVFAGGFTVEAAETVCSGEGMEEIEVLQILGQLVDRSLVVTNDRPGGIRHTMLETLRQYAHENLQASEEEGALRARHFEWVTSLVTISAAAMRGPEGADHLARLDREHDNIRSALDWGPQHDPEQVLLTSTALWHFWHVRGYWSEGRRRLETALASAGELSDMARAGGLNALGWATQEKRDYPAARVLHNESLLLFRAIGDSRGIGDALHNLGNLSYFEGDLDSARSTWEQGLALRRSVGDRRGIVDSLSNLGALANESGDFPTASEYLSETLEVAQAIGDRSAEADALSNLGGVVQGSGDPAGARSLHERSLSIRIELGHRWGIANSLMNLGLLESGSDPGSAFSRFKQAADILEEIDDPVGFAECILRMGQTASSQGDLSQAASLLADALAACAAVKDRDGVAEALAELAAIAERNGDGQRANRLRATSVDVADERIELSEALRTV